MQCLLYSLNQAAEMLCMSRSSLEIYIKAGEIKARKIGHRWRIHRDELEAFAGKDHQTYWGVSEQGKTSRSKHNAA